MPNAHVTLTKVVCAHIRAAVKRELGGHRYRLEYSERERRRGVADYTGNALLWVTNATNAGMVQLEVALNTVGTDRIEGWLYVTLSDEGLVLDVSDHWRDAVEAVATLKPIEEARIARRDQWVNAVSRWRRTLDMKPRYVPIGILADRVQDIDTTEAQTDAELIRAAIVAGYKG